MAIPESIEQAVRDRFPEGVVSSEEISGTLTLTVTADNLVGICGFLKDGPEFRFDYLMSLTAVDQADRFELVYHLYSITLEHYVTLKVRADKDNAAVPSVTSVWRAADWQEREVFDMFGIRFEGHPDLRRILLEDDWEGYPLRKDYVES